MRTDSDGVTFESEQRTLRVEPVTDAIVRVVQTGEEITPPEESLIVESVPDVDVDWTVREGEETVTLSTAALSLEVDRSTAAFTWRGADGDRLVREPEDGGKSIAEVSPPLLPSRFPPSIGDVSAVFPSPSVRSEVSIVDVSFAPAVSLPSLPPVSSGVSVSAGSSTSRSAPVSLF